MMPDGSSQSQVSRIYGSPGHKDRNTNAINIVSGETDQDHPIDVIEMGDMESENSSKISLKQQRILGFSHQLNKINQKIQDIDLELASKIDDSSEDPQPKSNQKSTSSFANSQNKSLSSNMSLIKKQKINCITQLSKINQKVQLSDNNQSGSNDGPYTIQSNGYSEDNFEKSIASNDSKSKFDAKNSQNQVQTSKTNSMSIKQMIHDDPYKGIEDEEIEIDEINDNILVNEAIKEEDEFDLSHSKISNSIALPELSPPQSEQYKQKQVSKNVLKVNHQDTQITKIDSVIKENAGDAKPGQQLPLVDASFERQRLRMEAPSRSITEQQTISVVTKSSRVQIGGSNQTRPKSAGAYSKRVLIRSDSQASVKIKVGNNSRNGQESMRCRTFRSMKSVSSHVSIGKNGQINKIIETKEIHIVKNVQRDVLQIQIMPEKSKSPPSKKKRPINKRKSDKSGSKLDIKSDQKEKVSGDILLSDTDSKQRQDRPLSNSKSKSKRLSMNQRPQNRPKSNKNIKSQIDSSSEIPISEDNSPLSPLSDEHASQIQNQSPNFGKLNPDLDMINNQRESFHLEPNQIEAVNSNDMDQYLYHKPEESPKFEIKHYEVKTQEEFDDLIQAQKEEDMKLLINLEKIELQKRYINQQKINDSKKYQSNLLQLQKLEEEERNLIWIKDPDALKIINYEGHLQSKSRSSKQFGVNTNQSRASKNSRKSSNSIINVDKSYQLIRDLKKKFKIGEENEQSNNKSINDISQEQLINISVVSGDKRMASSSQKKAKIEKIT